MSSISLDGSLHHYTCVKLFTSNTLEMAFCLLTQCGALLAMSFPGQGHYR